MSQSGPIGLNLVAVGWVLDNCYESVDNKNYQIERLRVLISALLKKLRSSTE